MVNGIPATGIQIPSFPRVEKGEMPATGNVGSQAPSFKDLLAGLVDQVDSAQRKADVAVESLATGGNTSIREVVLSLEEAGVAFQLMKEVRDKLVSAYKEVMSMQS
jgi:flagellar hook-basal body complex protein FliE